MRSRPRLGRPRRRRRGSSGRRGCDASAPRSRPRPASRGTRPAAGRDRSCATPRRGPPRSPRHRRRRRAEPSPVRAKSPRGLRSQPNEAQHRSTIYRAVHGHGGSAGAAGRGARPPGAPRRAADRGGARRRCRHGPAVPSAGRAPPGRRRGAQPQRADAGADVYPGVRLRDPGAGVGGAPAANRGLRRARGLLDLPHPGWSAPLDAPAARLVDQPVAGDHDDVLRPLPRRDCPGRFVCRTHFGWRPALELRPAPAGHRHADHVCRPHAWMVRRRAAGRRQGWHRAAVPVSHGGLAEGATSLPADYQPDVSQRRRGVGRGPRWEGRRRHRLRDVGRRPDVGSRPADAGRTAAGLPDVPGDLRPPPPEGRRGRGSWWLGLRLLRPRHDLETARRAAVAIVRRRRLPGRHALVDDALRQPLPLVRRRGLVAPRRPAPRQLELRRRRGGRTARVGAPGHRGDDRTVRSGHGPGADVRRRRELELRKRAQPGLTSKTPGMHAAELEADFDVVAPRPHRRAAGFIVASVVVIASAATAWVHPDIALLAAAPPAPLAATQHGDYVVASVDFVNATTGWLLADLPTGDYALIHTSDGGDTWTRQLGGATQGHTIYVKFFDESVGVVAMTGTQPVTRWTSDGGRSWV